MIQHLTDEVVKSPHNMVGKISFSSEMLFNQNILESFYRDYSENENSFIQNACIPVRMLYDKKNIHCFIQCITYLISFLAVI